MTKQIKICLGSSCFSRGNNVNLEAIQQWLVDNKLEAEIEFSAHLCHENCKNGPVITINEKVFEGVNISRLYKILQEEFAC